MPSMAADLIRNHLTEILSSSGFRDSQRMSRFLGFVVERSLADEGPNLKEYLIGVEVFDRKPSYDPRVDPIVRVEARRLRSKLAAWYRNEGRASAVRIELPVGTYAPSFISTGTTTSPPRLNPPELHRRRLPCCHSRTCRLTPAASTSATDLQRSSRTFSRRFPNCRWSPGIPPCG